eukprot:4604979-Pleurochrysis_carterae.AAC.4
MMILCPPAACRCVICKGENRFPATLPRPVLSALPLSMPVACSEPAEPQSESGRMLSLLQLDEFRLAASEAGVEDEAETRAQLLRAVQSLDSHTLRLFNAACKAERNARALDLAVQASASAASPALGARESGGWKEG